MRFPFFRNILTEELCCIDIDKLTLRYYETWLMLLYCESNKETEWLMLYKRKNALPSVAVLLPVLQVTWCGRVSTVERIYCHWRGHSDGTTYTTEYDRIPKKRGISTSRYELRFIYACLGSTLYQHISWWSCWGRINMQWFIVTPSGGHPFITLVSLA